MDLAVQPAAFALSDSQCRNQKVALESPRLTPVLRFASEAVTISPITLARRRAAPSQRNVRDEICSI